jgi:hypothetical protein
MGTYNEQCPNWILVNNTEIFSFLNLLPFNKGRTRAMDRIGPHSKEVLSIIICGMLGDFWANEIKGNQLPSVRFCIEQSVKNSAYIHFLSLQLFELGYCSSFVPKLIKKSRKHGEAVLEFNYRLTLFTFTSLHWIYESFYYKENGINIKRVPS